MLRAYEAFLTKKGAARTQYVPYYLKWVSDCYVFLNEPLSTHITGVLPSYAESYGLQAVDECEEGTLRSFKRA
jgi:hypothetical protein